MLSGMPGFQGQVEPSEAARHAWGYLRYQHVRENQGAGASISREHLNFITGTQLLHCAGS